MQSIQQPTMGNLGSPHAQTNMGSKPNVQTTLANVPQVVKQVRELIYRIMVWFNVDRYILWYYVSNEAVRSTQSQSKNRKRDVCHIISLNFRSEKLCF